MKGENMNDAHEGMTPDEIEARSVEERGREDAQAADGSGTGIHESLERYDRQSLLDDMYHLLALGAPPSRTLDSILFGDDYFRSPGVGKTVPPADMPDSFQYYAMDLPDLELMRELAKDRPCQSHSRASIRHSYWDAAALDPAPDTRFYGDGRSLFFGLGKRDDVLSLRDSEPNDQPHVPIQAVSTKGKSVFLLDPKSGKVEYLTHWEWLARQVARGSL